MTPKRIQILIEVSGEVAPDPQRFERTLGVDGLELDPDFGPISLRAEPSAPRTWVYRGRVEDAQLDVLRKKREVAKVWSDGQGAPF